MDGRAKRALVASAATAIMLPGLTGTAWAQEAPPDTHDHTYDTWDDYDVDYDAEQADTTPPPTEPVFCDETDVFDPYSGQCVEAETAQAPDVTPPPTQTVDDVHYHHHYHDHVQDWVYVVLHNHEDPATTPATDGVTQPAGTYVAYDGETAPVASDGATAPVDEYYGGFPAWWFEFH